MIKQFISLCALSICLSTLAHAQLQQIPFQSKISLYPDPENLNGCMIIFDGVRNEMTENGLTMNFNFIQAHEQDDIELYLNNIGMPEASVAFYNKELLIRVFDKQNTEPLQINGMLSMNTRNIHCMFEVNKKKNKQSQMISELSFSIPYVALGYEKPGEVKLIIELQTF